MPRPPHELIAIDVDDAVATLTLTAPQAGNAMSWEMLEELGAALRWIADRDDLRALILTGQDDSFCSGGDMDQWHRARGSLADPARRARADAARAVRLINEHMTALRGLSIITAAAINGFTVGAGVGLALACDLRVASSDARILFGYSRLGVSVDGGLSWLLPRIVGEAKAVELLLDDRPLKPARALELGIVSRLTDGDALAETQAWVQRLVRRNPPLYVGAIKQLVSQQPAASFCEQLAAERALMISTIATADAVAAFEAFSRGEPLPEFHGLIEPAVNAEVET
jgi:2-(1,2-epoxy-1,2-dihydrophenyl)acetyl-CoA isomerase